MIPASERCQCCGRTQPASQFPVSIAQPLYVCTSCQSLTPYAAAVLARETCELEHRVALQSKAARKAKHIERKLAEYAQHGKRCSSCHEAKPAAEYGACVSRTDGLQPECRQCINTRNALYRANNKPAWTMVRDALREKNKV